MLNEVHFSLCNKILPSFSHGASNLVCLYKVDKLLKICASFSSVYSQILSSSFFILYHTEADPRKNISPRFLGSVGGTVRRWESKGHFSLCLSASGAFSATVASPHLICLFSNSITHIIIPSIKFSLS